MPASIVAFRIRLDAEGFTRLDILGNDFNVGYGLPI